MDKKLLKYRAEFDINKANLYYLIKPNDIFVKNGVVEIFENHEKGYRILARLTSQESNSAIKSLILEKFFAQEQNINDFHEYVKSELTWYLNRLKFIADEHSVFLNISGEVTDPKGNKFNWTSTRMEIHVHVNDSLSLEKSLCMRIGKAKNSLFNIDEYIERYTAISELQDSVLRLITLATLYELIGDDLKEAGYKLDENSVAEYELIKEATGSEFSRIEVLAISARNLIAHGNASRPRTIKSLNKFWKLPLDTKHKFNRKNKEHMSLVRWASDRYSFVIKALIEAML